MQASFTGRAVSAQVSGGRLVFTDATAGESRLAFTLTAGLQGGTLDFGGTSTTYGRTRQLSAGADAIAVVDGATVQGSTNVLSGAVGGAALTLLAAEPATTLETTVTADPGASVSAVQGLVAQYNAFRAAVTGETQAGGRLAFASSARAVVGALNGTLLADLAGLATDATVKRAGAVGLSLQKDGTLALDTAVFKAAVEADPAAVRALFAGGGASSVTGLEYVSAGDATSPGTYAVQVTQLPQRAQVTGTAFAGYTGGGTPATMTVTDTMRAKVVSVTLRDGDTPEVLAARLNAAFTAQRAGLVADVSGGALRLRTAEAGAEPSFTVAYDDPGGESPATQLGIAAGTVANGVDAAGTIDGTAATGKGSLLTGANGLVVRVAGTSLPISGDVRFAAGVAGLFSRQLDAFARAGSGYVAQQTDAASVRVDQIDRRTADIEARLERRRAALIEQFSLMEAAVSRFQAQGQWLAGQVASLPKYSSNS